MNSKNDNNFQFKCKFYWQDFTYNTEKNPELEVDDYIKAMISYLKL